MRTRDDYYYTLANIIESPHWVCMLNFGFVVCLRTSL